ncbi:conserved hypothetical protein [uncultured Pleomorphomonas sp.]|uniref:Uncharacterized protein n=1 Tax=uncultured Pleomorphomonas sp. TaxID=442121 RepID=A0A212LCB2_9HYPH|nr:hypothetical protein [uncultured Pleomorphomonas sp.]SCM70015.1 conserved hypothetical protein [uncultured Pleomorphomonas sp.]SCM75128.1 conserved hypothetical protein [uncultured Pleomorphomonas sp.]
MADLQKLLCAEVRRNLKGGDRPRIPAGGELLWRWFSDLSGTRQAGFGGPLPITFNEIAAYARLFAIPIAPRHVAILKAMDAAFLDEIAESTPPSGVKVAPRVSPRPLSGALFDANF